MEEKLQFVPSLKDAFAIGVKNLVPIVLSVLLWLVTVWIPYVNVGTTIALATLPVKLSKGEMISPMFILTPSTVIAWANTSFCRLSSSLPYTYPSCS